MGKKALSRSSFISRLSQSVDIEGCAATGAACLRSFAPNGSFLPRKHQRLPGAVARNVVHKNDLTTGAETLLHDVLQVMKTVLLFIKCNSAGKKRGPGRPLVSTSRGKLKTKTRCQGRARARDTRCGRPTSRQMKMPKNNPGTARPPCR